MPRAIVIVAHKRHRSIAPAGAPPAGYAITHGCAVGWNLTPLPRLDTASDNIVRVGNLKARAPRREFIFQNLAGRGLPVPTWLYKLTYSSVRAAK